MATDLELVELAKAGDVEAFASLIKRYERSVLAIVQAEVRDPTMAINVTLKAWKRAFRRLDNLPEGSHFGPWLLRLTRRQTINALRTMPIPVGAVSDPSGTNGNLDSYDSDWIENEHLLGLIVRLPEDERQLISLRFFDNQSPVEIAEIVDRPVNEVTRQIARAVARLRHWWEWEQE